MLLRSLRCCTGSGAAASSMHRLRCGHVQGLAPGKREEILGCSGFYLSNQLTGEGHSREAELIKPAGKGTMKGAASERGGFLGSPYNRASITAAQTGHTDASQQPARLGGSPQPGPCAQGPKNQKQPSPAVSTAVRPRAGAVLWARPAVISSLPNLAAQEPSGHALGWSMLRCSEVVMAGDSGTAEFLSLWPLWENVCPQSRSQGLRLR